MNRPARKHLSNRSTLLCVLLLLSGLRSSWAEEIPFRTLAQASHSGLVKATNLVIKSSVEWEKLWKSHQGMSDPPAKVPTVDFAKEMVVAAALGRKPTGGYGIEIKRIESTTSTVKIFITQRSPGPDALVTQALSAPVHFVAVARRDLKPEFILEARAPRK